MNTATILINCRESLSQMNNYPHRFQYFCLASSKINIIRDILKKVAYDTTKMAHNREYGYCTSKPIQSKGWAYEYGDTVTSVTDWMINHYKLSIVEPITRFK
jgi:hypothetical protein